MRHKSLLAVTILVVAFMLALSWGGHAQSSSRMSWEYKVVVAQYGAMPPSLSEQDMNKLGAEGWELVGTRVVEFPQGGSIQYRSDYYFKRAR